MKANRRNYYRCLHVQPEAPQEIIAASYRTLMTKLGRHPDHGGDPEQAILLNQAYAVLKDPVKRREYDRRLAQQQARAQGSSAAGAGRSGRNSAETAAPGAGAPGRGAAAAEAAWASARQADAQTGSASGPGAWQPGAGAVGACAFCLAGLPDNLTVDTRCRCCGSPLAPLPAVSLARRELLGRRRAPRTAKTETVRVVAGWQQAAQSGRLRDLSMSGLSVVLVHPVKAGQVIRVTTASLDMLARVVACRRTSMMHVAHAELLHVIFNSRRGVFVSTEA